MISLDKVPVSVFPESVSESVKDVERESVWEFEIVKDSVSDREIEEDIDLERE